MPISIEGVKTEGASAQGLSVSWEDGQFVVIVLPQGIVGCAAIDVSVMEEFDMAVATAHPRHRSWCRTTLSPQRSQGLRRKLRRWVSGRV